MDEILLNRLNTFASNILTLSKDAETLCVNRPWDGEKREQATIKASKLQSVLNRFNADLYQYFNTSSSPNADEISILTTSQLQGEERLAELNAIIQTDKDCQLKPSSTHVNNRCKLPELNLPRFKGNILCWFPFWDQFYSNIGQRNLQDVDKLLYLKASLEGEAKNLIEGLDSTNENYQIAVNVLKDRYGKREQVIDAHYSTLYKVKPAVRFEECRKTLDEIEKHLRVLQSMGENTSHNHLRFLIMEKFPENIIYEMKLKVDTESIEDMRKQLNIIITAREDAKGFDNGNRSEEPRYTTETLHARTIMSNGRFNKAKPKFVKHGRNPFRNKPVISAFAGTSRPIKRKFETQGNWNSYGQKQRRIQCVFCEGNHDSDGCNKYPTATQRRERIGRRCFLCLRLGHFMRECPSNLPCSYCNLVRNHHNALCHWKFPDTNSRPTNIFHVHDEGCTILQTAITDVQDKNGTSKRCRLLLDSGSQRSYVTQDIAKELKLDIEEENHLLVFTFGAKKPQEIDSPLVKLHLRTKVNKSKEVYVNVVPSITHGISYPKQELVKGIHGKEILLADDGTLSDRIDILIGNDYYHSMMLNEKIQLEENLYLIDSMFGWILSGRSDNTPHGDEMDVLTYFQSSYENKWTKPDPPLDNTSIQHLWDLESIGIMDSPNMNREEEAIKNFNESTEIINKRYYVTWPWKEYPPNLPTNYSLAYGRLVGLMKRLDSETLIAYNQTINDQIQKGVVEQAPEIGKVDHPVHYLPHHGVLVPGKALRIVYDASAKTKDTKSLNECLYCGPKMLEDLTGLLIRFRCHSIGLTADVEKAFLQMGLKENDRDVTRFLWLKDTTKPVTLDNLIHYRFTRVPFGIISSPFLLNATIRHLLLNSNSEHAKGIANDIYVDNLLTGANSVEEAMDLYRNVKRVFQQISMNIREWSSNSKEFTSQIPDVVEDKTIKTLGLNWNLDTDTLQLRLKLKDNQYTKRGILKSVASIFDPCGFAAPITLPAKILFQSLWKEKKLDWDTKLSENTTAQWRNILEDFDRIKEICLPRNMSRGKEAQLHCFTDSSTKAYAAVVYLVQNDNIQFIMGKSRLTPLKDLENLKIPRLELLGVLIGTRLIQFILKFIKVNVTQLTLWTDSQIAINWCQTDKLLDTFVSRRVDEIKRVKSLTIKYIPSIFNPADVATRPMKTHGDLDRWLYGPSFLSEKSINWPTELTTDTVLLAGEALPSTSDIVQVSDKEDVVDVCVDTSNELTSQNDLNTIPAISPTKVNSETQEIINLQKQFFPDESKDKITNLTRNLGLFKDVDGVIRCDGRLTHSDLSYETKHPILLPRNCKFTEDIIMKTHEMNYHVGTSHTLSLIRQKFWIPQGRAQVQRILSKCPQCVKHGGGPYALPDTPALPPERVKYTSAFTYVGVDYFGPMLVKSDKSQEKRWICLFTCLVIRAIHLEVVKDMTTEECSLAFRRFIANRGVPTLILSDNALQFRLLSEIMTTKELTEKGILWKFIPQLAPWHGGVYERLVGIVKHCLKRSLQKHLLNDSQLLTIIKEVEGIVNTRPLTYVTSGLEHILKPADFLTPGKCINLQNLEDNIATATTSTKQQLVEGWKRGEIIMNEYKDMFIGQYLLSLRERNNHSPNQSRVKSHRQPCIGDIVQIKNENKNRGSWKVGSICELLRGTDGSCRVARVKVGDTVFTRSIGHLYQ